MAIHHCHHVDKQHTIFMFFFVKNSIRLDNVYVTVSHNYTDYLSV